MLKATLLWVLFVHHLTFALPEFVLFENDTSAEAQAMAAWKWDPQQQPWFRLMPPAADVATATVHTLLHHNLNLIHVPFGNEVEDPNANPSSPAEYFAQECNEAIHTAMLNQGTQLMPEAVAQVAIVYSFDETEGLQRVISFRNRTGLHSLPTVLLTPLSVSAEWGLWSVADTVSLFSNPQVALLSSGPVYHASAFSSGVVSASDSTASNSNHSTVEASVETIHDISLELYDSFSSQGGLTSTETWLSMTVGPIGWGRIGFCGQGLRHVYLTVLDMSKTTREWPMDVMQGSSSFHESCGAARVYPPQYRGMALVYSGILATDFSDALEVRLKNVELHNRPVHLQLVDDGYVPTNTRPNIERAVQNHPPCLAIAGVYGTPTSSVAVSILESSKEEHGIVPFFGPFTGSSEMRHPYRRNIINVRASMADEAHAIVNALADWGRLRVAMLYLGTSFGTQGVSAVNASLAAAGGVMLHAEGTPYGNPDYEGAMDRMQAALGSEEPLAFVLWQADAAVIALTELIRERYGREVVVMVTSTGGGIQAMAALSSDLGHNVYFARAVAPESGKSQSSWVYQEGYLAGELLVQGLRTAFDKAAVGSDGGEGGLDPTPYMEPLGEGMDGSFVDPFMAKTKEEVQFLRDALVDSVYEQSYFKSPTTSDVLGPFTDTCNQATQKVYITGVTPSGEDTFIYTSSALECSDNEAQSAWTIPVGVTLPLTGARSAEAEDILNGLRAAMHGINSQGLVPGYEVVLEVMDDEGHGDRARDNIGELVTNHSVGAIVCPLGSDVAEVLPTASEAYSVPILGPISGLETLRIPYQPLLINIRAGIQDEVQLVVQHAMALSHTRVALIHPDSSLGLSTKKSLEVSLNNQGLRLHAEVNYTSGMESPSILMSSLQVASGITPPQALLLVVNETTAAEMIKLLRTAWAGLDIHVYLLSALHLENGVRLLGDATNGVFATGMMPDPQGDSSAAAMYRKHLSAICSGCKANLEGMEAYVTLRALAAIMSDTDDSVLRSLNQPRTTASTKAANRRALGNTVYEKGLITVDDIRLGAYGPACENDIGCSCNQGARKVYLYEATTVQVTEEIELDDDKVVESTISENHWEPLPDDTLFFDTCGISAVPLPVDQRPIVFGQSVDLTTSAGRATAAGVRLAFAAVNRKGGVRGRELRLITYDDTGKGDIASENARDMMERHNVFGFIGFGGLRPDPVIDAFEYVTEAFPDVPFIAGDAPSVLLRNPVTPTSITVTSSLQEEATAAIRFARENSRLNVAIIHEDTRTGRDAAASLSKAAWFYRTNVVTVSKYFVGRSTAMAVVDLLTAETKPDVVLFYGDTESFQTIIQSYYDSLSYTNEAPPSSSPEATWFIGMSTVSVLKLVQTLPIGFQHVTFVTSGLPVAWTDDAAVLLANLLGAIALDESQDTEALLYEEGTRMFNGFIAGRLTALILERAPAVSRQGFVDTVYATQLFYVDDLQLGPFYYNHFGGNSDCSMGLRKSAVIDVLSYTRYLSPEANSYSYQANYTLDLSASQSCGVYTEFSRPPCSAGYERVYTTEDTEAFVCRECERGFYSSDGFVCTPCPPGSFSTSSQSAECTLCPPGHYQDRGEQSQCLPCDTSSYAEGFGNAACMSCGRNALTRTTASTSASACVCLGGYYGNALAGVGEEGAGCQRCPDGGNCCAYPVDKQGQLDENEWMKRTNSTTSLDVCDLGVVRPVPLPGYVESSVLDTGIVRCRRVDACGGVLDYAARNSTSRCESGYEGLHCGTCSDGYFRFYGDCQRCGDEGVQWIRVVGMVFFFMVLVLMSVEFSARKSTYSGLSLLLNFLQIMGLFNDFWMDWPSMLQSFVGFSALVNLQLDMFAPECKLQALFPVDFYERLMMWLSLPLLLLLGYVVTFFIAMSIVYSLQSCLESKKKKRRRRTRRASLQGSSSSHAIARSITSKRYRCGRLACRRKTVHRFLGVSRLYSLDLQSSIKVFRSAFFRVLVAIYPVLLSRSLSMFRCVQLEDGVSVMEGYYSEVCYSDRWWDNVHLGIIGTLVYGIGMPLILMTILCRARRDRIRREVRRKALQFYKAAGQGKGDARSQLPTELDMSVSHDSSDSEVDQYFLHKPPSKFDLKAAKKEAASMATLGLVGHYHSIWPFVIDYRPLAWYWTLMEQLEFIGIVVASTFIQLPVAQLLIALLTIGGFSVFMLVVKPYDHLVFNKLEVVNDLVQVSLLMVGISHVSNPPTASEEVLNGFSVLLLITAFVGIVLGFYFDLKEKLLEWRGNHSFRVVKKRKDWASSKASESASEKTTSPRALSPKPSRVYPIDVIVSNRDTQHGSGVNISGGVGVSHVDMGDVGMRDTYRQTTDTSGQEVESKTALSRQKDVTATSLTNGQGSSILSHAHNDENALSSPAPPSLDAACNQGDDSTSSATPAGNRSPVPEGGSGASNSGASAKEEDVDRLLISLTQDSNDH